MVLVDSVFGSMVREGRIATLPILFPNLVDMAAALQATIRREDRVVVLGLKEELQFVSAEGGRSEEIKTLQVSVVGLELDLTVKSHSRFLFKALLLRGERQWVVQGWFNSRTRRATLTHLFPV